LGRIRDPRAQARRGSERGTVGERDGYRINTDGPDALILTYLPGGTLAGPRVDDAEAGAGDSLQIDEVLTVGPSEDDFIAESEEITQVVGGVADVRADGLTEGREERTEPEPIEQVAGKESVAIVDEQLVEDAGKHVPLVDAAEEDGTGRNKAAVRPEGGGRILPEVVILPPGVALRESDGSLEGRQQDDGRLGGREGVEGGEGDVWVVLLEVAGDVRRRAFPADGDDAGVGGPNRSILSRLRAGGSEQRVSQGGADGGPEAGARGLRQQDGGFGVWERGWDKGSCQWAGVRTAVRERQGGWDVGHGWVSFWWFTILLGRCRRGGRQFRRRRPRRCRANPGCRGWR